MKTVIGIYLISSNVLALNEDNLFIVCVHICIVMIVFINDLQLVWLKSSKTTTKTKY